MLEALSGATSWTERFSRLAFCSSRKLTRLVEIQPGTTMFAVTPSRPTSRDSVFDQPTKERRKAVEMARLGIGATTPEVVEVMILPHLRRRMPGKTLSVNATTERAILCPLCPILAGGW